jgi:hypothetical protein
MPLLCHTQGASQQPVPWLKALRPDTTTSCRVLWQVSPSTHKVMSMLIIVIIIRSSSCSGQILPSTQGLRQSVRHNTGHRCPHTSSQLMRSPSLRLSGDRSYLWPQGPTKTQPSSCRSRH